MLWNKIIGGALLIIGTSIGAGMLALPLATAAGGFHHALYLFFGTWIVTVFAAFLILEVNLWLPENTNLVSMAKATLGKAGEAFTSLFYLLLLYSLMAAYTAGGSDLLQSFFTITGVNLPEWLDAVVFVVVFGTILYAGIASVDWANRTLMSMKLVAYIFLIVLITPHIDVQKLIGGRYALLGSAVMVVVTSFGYATIIPSLRTYFKSDVKSLRWTILLGSLISLLFYLLWDLAVQGTISATGENGLVEMATSGQAASQLTMALSNEFDRLISDLARIFTTICLITSFLGVGLCLTDFIDDGLRVIKVGHNRLSLMMLVLGPPLAVVLFFPGAFITGLRFAGVFCVLLLILLPVLMAWSGRYVKQIARGYEVWGGRTTLVIELFIGLVLLGFGFWYL